MLKLIRYHSNDTTSDAPEELETWYFNEPITLCISAGVIFVQRATETGIVRFPALPQNIAAIETWAKQ